ncbi:folate-binding protein YgfZ [Chitinimonas arctica]|uniref:Folate-binding protein YgfZ n=1 Tax=Chitinimonas arctica TaxID=2594795 RepID=A0A516SIH9_9NEIS|nr:folate-binding protein YgfZ [Chitinimonas arctica]QDQ27848.1 folate-binding protein YgfZ [Chitinimonas arctica]
MAWYDLLGALGAQFDEDGATRFDASGEQAGMVALAQGAALVPLRHFGLIRFSGEETSAFLQGQLSSDIKKLPAAGCQYSSYSTPKGRMLASFLILREGEDLLLMLPRPLLPAIQKRLAMYVMRSKTRPADISDERVLLGLAGPRALELAREVFGELPKEAHQGMPCEGGHLVRLPADRLLLNLAAEAAGACWDKLLAAGAQAAGADAWTLSDIHAGIPWVLPATQEEFVAQMANMELIGAVSFKKGCYPGQEIVARTQYLGKLKRRTFRVRADTAMHAGDAVYSPEMNGQASGQIALAAPSGDGRWEALAVVQLASVAQGVHLESPNGTRLEFLPLPYPVHE